MKYSYCMTYLRLILCIHVQFIFIGPRPHFANACSRLPLVTIQLIYVDILATLPERYFLLLRFVLVPCSYTHNLIVNNEFLPWSCDLNSNVQPSLNIADGATNSSDFSPPPRQPFLLSPKMETWNSTRERPLGLANRSDWAEREAFHSSALAQFSQRCLAKTK